MTCPQKFESPTDQKQFMSSLVFLFRDNVMPSYNDKPRRVRHDIICQILETARKGVKKTPMMHKLSLNYTQLQKYLKALEKADLIREESGIWQTTEYGIKVIEACRICQGLMSQIGLSETKSPDRTQRTR